MHSVADGYHGASVISPTLEQIAVAAAAAISQPAFEVVKSCDIPLPSRLRYERADLAR